MFWVGLHGERDQRGYQKHCFVILCKGTFDTFELVGSLDGMSKVRRLHRGGCGEYLVMLDGRFYVGKALVKEGAV